MINPCPLIFEPIFKPKVWGGRNLARLLGKQLPTDEPYGESWECADLEQGQSVVGRGPAKGRTLHELIEAWGPRLLGRAKLTDGRFPLLIKFLDAAADLSVQVHPDPETARRLGGEVRVKHEAWHILEAREGACIYRGLVPGTTVQTLTDAMARNPEAILEYLQRIPVKVGHTYFLPSGTLHALGWSDSGCTSRTAWSSWTRARSTSRNWVSGTCRGASSRCSRCRAAFTVGRGHGGPNPLHSVAQSAGETGRWRGGFASESLFPDESQSV